MSENINKVRVAIENIINLKDNDNSSDEIFLGSHYNEMLKCEELITKINLSQHHRILANALKHENEIPINYENLISFIVAHLNNNENFNILLTLIDVNKLKRTDLLKITKCPNFQESMFNIPKHYFLESLENEHKQTSDKIDEIKNEIQSISKKNVENINSIKLEISNLFNQFVQESINQINLSINNNITQSKTDILNSINNITTLVGNQSNSINSQIENQIVNVHNNIDDKYSKINERIDSIHKNIDGVYGKVNERINSVHKNIDDTYNKINERINSVHQNINEKSESNTNNINEKFDKCNKNIENKFNSLVNNANEINVKLLSTSSNVENNSISIKTEIKNIKDQLTQNNSNNNNLKSDLNTLKTQLSQKISDSNNTLISDLKNIKNQLTQNNKDNNSLKSDLSDFKSQLSQKINDNKSSLNTEIYCSKNSINENIRSLSDLILFKANLPINFDYDKNTSYYNGLFNYCFQTIGNPLKNKIFEITGNPEKGYEDVLYEICDKKNDRDYKSQNTSDSYLQIDFKNRSFLFKAIKIYNHSENGNTIKDFTIEGSENGYTWVSFGNWYDIDKWMPGPNKCCECWLNNPSNSYYRFFKIKLNGTNTSGNYQLALKRFELYGILK